MLQLIPTGTSSGSLRQATENGGLNSPTPAVPSLRPWAWSLAGWAAWSLILLWMWIGLESSSYLGMISAGLILALVLPILNGAPTRMQAASLSTPDAPRDFDPTLEQQLRQSQKMEVVGRLAGGVAHDFNNLLTVIQGYGELLLHELQTNHRARDMVAEIMKAGQRASALTRQLLFFSRKQVPQPTVVDVNILLTNLENMLRRLVTEDINVVILREAAPLLVKIDPGQLEQVIMNLVVNARDAMPVGGDLTLSARREETSNRAILTIRDTGQGMSEEIKAQLFQPFFTTKEPGKGTGLGLATVKGIVEHFGGSITVESQPRKGAEFIISLPLTEDVPQIESPPPVTPQRLARETILLVEDEEGVRKLARTVLTRLGYRVVEARNGQEALETCRKLPGAPDVVVTDVVMPGMSGVDLVSALQTLYPGLRTMYMSGYNESTVLRHGLQDETTICLHKPFTPDDLCEAVQEMFESPRRV